LTLGFFATWGLMKKIELANVRFKNFERST